MNSVRRNGGLGLLACALAVSLPATSGVLFQDGFEAGRKGPAQNGFTWSDNTNGIAVSNAQAFTGSYSLLFPFEAVPQGEDSFQEQRIRFGRQMTDVWISYDLYVPSNYAHRSDSPSNNKFFAIFNNNYNPGFQVNFSLTPDGQQGSRIGIYYFSTGDAQPAIDYGTMISPADRGRWMHVVMHFKCPTNNTGSDGAAEIWKNGTAIVSNRNLDSGGTSQGLNYMDEAYILGWANSGFTQETRMYVDNFVLSDTALPLTADGRRPSAPVVVGAQ